MFPQKGDRMASVWPAVSRQLLSQLRSVKKEKKMVMATLPDASDSSSPDTLYKQIIGLSHGIYVTAGIQKTWAATVGPFCRTYFMRTKVTLLLFVLVHDSKHFSTAFTIQTNQIYREQVVTVSAGSSVALMRRCQPALLQGWTPVDVIGDGNTYEPRNDTVY